MRRRRRSVFQDPDCSMYVSVCVNLYIRNRLPFLQSHTTVFRLKLKYGEQQWILVALAQTIELSFFLVKKKYLSFFLIQKSNVHDLSLFRPPKISFLQKLFKDLHPNLLSLHTLLTTAFYLATNDGTTNSITFQRLY